MRLGVNIDHIATLREARKEKFPDPVLAARECIAGGADGIVCHLREDRRHIQDDDLRRLRRLDTRLDLEMALTDEMLGIALKIKPDMVTIVPEKRREVTTEGGLDIKSKLQTSNFQIITKIQKLKSKNIIVSLFVDPEEGQIEASARAGADFVELHTGEYARDPRKLSKVRQAARLASKLGLRVNAGHGLDYNNVGGMVALSEIEELNIGFSIIARSVFVGMKQAVSEMRKIIDSPHPLRR
jgi:pyridoxine 5-phosphate synthase